MRNLQICALFVRQLKLMILINCMQSEDCVNFVDCVFCTRERDLAMHCDHCRYFLVFPGLAICMHEKMVAARVSVRQSPNAYVSRLMSESW